MSEPAKIGPVHDINWKLIERLPMKYEVVTGGPDYGAYAVAHIPENNHCVEAMLAQDGTGTYQRLRAITGKPGKVRFTPASWIAGTIREIVESRKVRELKESF
jgi:hypothetical protein